ncbi:hypothetical protein EJ03DRAFT_329087 [Teratosphaeria nubilosa]|uniref:Uncharacterized protein n=1 Tax=Teratosphaeria nubilosa TaxID=161662 RepID=A0A6G1L3V9_9PEZI|nr:hypothetical protein EJ03DRAFT_329087 [Teratosphaeria nubilosa]
MNSAPVKTQARTSRSRASPNSTALRHRSGISVFYLIGYFLLGDGLNTTGTVIGTLQNEIVAFKTLMRLERSREGLGYFDRGFISNGYQTAEGLSGLHWLFWLSYERCTRGCCADYTAQSGRMQ